MADRPQFIDRINNPQNYPYIQNEDGSVSSHRMAAEVDEGGNWSVFPTIQMIDGKLKQFDDNRTAMRSAFETGNYLPMDSAEEAIRYAEGGYKVGTPMDPSRREAPSMRNLTPSQEANLSGATSLRRFVNPEVQARPDMITPIVPTLTDRARNLAVDVFGNSPVGRRRTQTAMRALETIDPGFLILDEAQRSWNEGNIGESLVGTAIGLSGVVPGVRQAGKAVKAGARGVTSMRSIGGDIPVVTRDTNFGGEIVQTAEAGKVIQTLPRDFINEKGYSTSPLMAATDLESRPENIAVGSYRGLVNRYRADPDYAMREQARMLGGRYTQPEDLFMESAAYEDLLGSPLVILPADKSIYGKVDRVAGIDIDPVLAEGGPQHLDRYGNWMSMEGAAKTKQAHVNRVREETQKDPVLMYTAMANEGSNFSVPPSNIAVNMIKEQGDLTREQANMFDTAIANLNQNTQDLKGIPESWSGYESPEQLLNWLTTDSPTASSGNKRKAFMGNAILNKPAFKTAGFPIPNDIYSVVNEQEMLNMPKGMSGARAMMSADVKPSDMEFNSTMNRSYNTVIPSLGGILIKEPMVPYDVMYPDPIAARAHKQDPYRSFQTSGGLLPGDYQMANEQWLEGVYQNLKSRGLK